jgi:hypothetical protein
MVGDGDGEATSWIRQQVLAARSGSYGKLLAAHRGLGRQQILWPRKSGDKAPNISLTAAVLFPLGVGFATQPPSLPVFNPACLQVIPTLSARESTSAMITFCRRVRGSSNCSCESHASFN